jgi:hypothetical protein
LDPFCHHSSENLQKYYVITHDRSRAQTAGISIGEVFFRRLILLVWSVGSPDMKSLRVLSVVNTAMLNSCKRSTFIERTVSTQEELPEFQDKSSIVCREILSAGAKPAKNMEIGAWRPVQEIQYGDRKDGAELLAGVKRVCG